MALWLVVQLSVVLMAVLRVPLAAQYPEPAERLAAHLLFGAQVVGAGLLFPYLLRDARCAVQVVASAWPFQLAAGYLAGMAPAALAWPASLVTAWLITLALYAALLRSPRSRALGVAAAALLTLGGGTLRYLRLEFASAGVDAAPAGGFENASPLLSTLAALDGLGTRPAWVLIATLASAALLALLAKARGRATTPPASVPGA